MGKYLKEFFGWVSLNYAQLLRNSEQFLSQLACELSLHGAQNLFIGFVQALVQWSPPHVPQVSLVATH